MIICGIDIKGSEARLVLIKGSILNFSHNEVKPPKLKLSDDTDQNEVKAFSNALYAFFRENKVELIAIKKRIKRGEYAGGPTGFKIEGIIQLYDGCPVKLVAPQSIQPLLKNHNPIIPNSILKYQHEAFKTAFGVLK